MSMATARPVDEVAWQEEQELMHRRMTPERRMIAQMLYGMERKGNVMHYVLRDIDPPPLYNHLINNLAEYLKPAEQKSES
jgi:hypothetical protein